MALGRIVASDTNSKKIVMAGLDPATQPPRVGEAKKPRFSEAQSHAVAWTRDALGGRVALRLPGHDDFFSFELNRTATTQADHDTERMRSTLEPDARVGAVAERLRR